MTRYIYYAVRGTNSGDLLGMLRAYSDGHHRDFIIIEETLHVVLCEHVTVSTFAMNWAEGDSLAAMGIPLIIYDPEGRRSEADKYSDTMEYASCDWTRLTAFQSLRATFES